MAASPAAATSSKKKFSKINSYVAYTRRSASASSIEVRRGAKRRVRQKVHAHVQISSPQEQARLAVPPPFHANVCVLKALVKHSLGVMTTTDQALQKWLQAAKACLSTANCTVLR